MHGMQICHRDLKPDNIIYEPATARVKIIDFGFAISCKEKLKLFCGTPSFMAPEIFSRQEYGGSATDIWACGVIMYNLLTGTLPFKRNED
jgi:MAP/microtubule affinity-regulating kinase